MGEKKHINEIPPQNPRDNPMKFLFTRFFLYVFFRSLRKFCAVPRSYPFAFPYFLHCLIGVETEALLDYRGGRGIISIVQKILAPIKMESALPPPKTQIVWAGFFLQREHIFPGVHKIGAAISVPRIAGRKFYAHQDFSELYGGTFARSYSVSNGHLCPHPPRAPRFRRAPSRALSVWANACRLPVLIICLLHTGRRRALSPPNRAIWCDCDLRFESRISNH